MLKKSSTRSGFTLIELVVVIGILSVLLAIVLVAINPGRQFKQANDTKRKSDVSAILNAVGQKVAFDKGVIPGAITATAKNIASGAAGADICSLIMPDYISALPNDPNIGGQVIDCATYDTGYQISTDGTRITVSAPSAALETISLTR